MGIISGSGYNFKALHQVLDKKELGEMVLVVYDYMEYEKGLPARNFVAYDHSGGIIWTAETPEKESSAYYQISSLDPLVVSSYCSRACTIDPANGKIVKQDFFK